MSQVTINCDMGEAFGIYRLGDDAACMPFVTHANIACGYHASDPKVMAETVRAAKVAGIHVGSHPGLPDREGFGRRSMQMTRDEVAALVIYQTGALKGFLEAEGMVLSHIKPHGALFGMAQNQEHVAEGIADAAEIFQVPVIAFSDCCMSSVFTRRNIPFSCEFYVDIDYDDEGRQIIAREHPPITSQVISEKVNSALKDGVTRSINGKEVRVVAESICVHSDTPDAVTVARAVYEVVASHNALNIA